MFRAEIQEGHFHSNLTFYFQGRLDTEACANDEKKIDERIADVVMPIVFDLKEAVYISSAFLRICIKVGKKIGKEKFTIINVSPQILKVFKIAGFDNIFTIK
ncbi:STAS domain-containing protein [bacterium]